MTRTPISWNIFLLKITAIVDGVSILEEDKPINLSVQAWNNFDSQLKQSFNELQLFHFWGSLIQEYSIYIYI
jgi:hypothetical protein